MRTFKVREDQIKGSIDEFMRAMLALADATEAWIEIMPCLEIRTDSPMLVAMLDEMKESVGGSVGGSQGDSRVAPTGPVAGPVVEAVAGEKPGRKKRLIVPTGKCSQCGKPAQLVKALGICKPCNMKNLKKAKAAGIDERIEQVVQAAKGKPDPFVMPHARQETIAVRKF